LAFTTQSDGELTAASEIASRRRASLAPLALGAVVSAALVAGILALLRGVQVLGGAASFDRNVARFALAERSPLATPVFYGLTVLANTGVVVTLTTAAAVFLLYRRRIAEAVLVVATVALGQLIGTIVKSVVARPRPPADSALIGLPATYAFPSGHALAAMLLYGVVAFLLIRAQRRAWAKVAIGIAAGLLIAGIGVSRVYLGVHWPTDVAAAWLLGGAWLSLCIGAYLSWKRREAARPHDDGRPNTRGD
jgi:undecaprenyl-diphosphatase